MRRLLGGLLGLVLVLAALAVPSPADAATSGDLVFSSGDLYLVHADGTGVRRLTFNGDSHDPAWSPDGRSVAYDHAGDIWVLTLGQTPRRLTHDGVSTDPAWSGDGSTIAFTRVVRLYLRDVFVVPAAGGKATRLSWMARAGCTSSEPSWSPSAHLVVYVRESALRPCSEGLVVQRPGSTAHVLVPDPAASGPEYTADGRHLLFLAPCDPELCANNGGWETTAAGTDRHMVVDQYQCAEGDLCLHKVAASPAGGWVSAATYADDTGFFETCFQGAHEDSRGTVVQTAPSFCVSRPAYDFDVRG